MTGTSLSEIINKKPVDLYDLTVAYAAESQLLKIDVTEEGDMVFELKLKKKKMKNRKKKQQRSMSIIIMTGNWIRI